jgi:hypothetical protein
VLALVARPACAQAPDDRSFAAAVTRAVVFDPTTYAPALVTYGATRLDWNSSQIFFHNGFVEQNQQFTASGRPNDAPLPYADGNRRILGKSIAVLELSALNNVTAHTVSRLLQERYPHHRTLVGALGWAERIGVASYLTYLQSSANFRQWRDNTRRADQLGLR